MKNIFFILGLSIFLYGGVFAQKDAPLDLSNVLIIGQQNRLQDRYALEGGLVRLFNQYHIKAIPSLNIVKEGGSPKILLTDSIRKLLKEKGIDTYLLVSIRGYDQKFKPAVDTESFESAIQGDNLYKLYDPSVTRVTFSFKFYKNLKLVHQELIRTGSVASEDTVMKKLLKAVSKRLQKGWR